MFFVNLARTGDGRGVAESFALALDFAPNGERPLPAQVIDRIAAKSALLVVDNCEHVLDDVAELIDDLPASCPNARVLATSREAIELYGEQTFRFPSLAVDAGPTAPAVGATVPRTRGRQKPSKLRSTGATTSWVPSNKAQLRRVSVIQLRKDRGRELCEWAETVDRKGHALPWFGVGLCHPEGGAKTNRHPGARSSERSHDVTKLKRRPAVHHPVQPQQTSSPSALNQNYLAHSKPARETDHATASDVVRNALSAYLHVA